MVSTGFQTQVGVVQAPAVEGDFSSTNPRLSVNAGPGGLIAGPLGCAVGRFGWLAFNPADGDGAPAAVNNYGSTKPDCIVPRPGQQALITTYLQTASMIIAPGFAMYAMRACDIWVKNLGSGQAVPGLKAFANLSNGTVSRFAATGTSASAGASGSTSSVAASTFSVTGSIGGTNGNTLTVTAVGSGTVVPGATISGTGIATGTKVTAQLLPLLTGEALGGIGRYFVDIAEQSVASTTVSGTYGTLTVAGTVVAGFAVGQSISGSSVVAGTTITALGTGTGGAGTYIVNNNTVVSSTAITAAGDIETDWIAESSGLQNELVKIRRQP